MSIKDPDYLRLYHLIEDHLLDCIPEVDDRASILTDAMRYSLLAGGKRIRPVLLLACCELAGERAETALPFACACEYIQTYSLIHDDLPGMDDDDLRRGKPTNHKVYGVGMAILAGDGLLSSAHEAMDRDMLLYLDRPELLKRRVRASHELAKGTGCMGMVAGQAADLTAEHGAPDPNMLSFIHANKTAAFIRSSVMCGAYLGGADRELLENLRVYGDCLGLAFQIVDDIEDVVSTPEERGKAVGGDAESEKLTYPAIYGIETSKSQALALIGKARAAVEKYGEAAQVLCCVADYLEKTIS